MKINYKKVAGYSLIAAPIVAFITAFTVFIGVKALLAPIGVLAVSAAIVACFEGGFRLLEKS